MELYGPSKSRFEALTISSGTIATLTGLRRYEDIDKWQADFVQFVDRGEYENWIIAYLAYTQQAVK